MHPRAYATEIVNKLKAAGYIAYFAGGWVRDYLLGHPSSDIDIATDAPTEVILDLFPHTILVGLAFGVVIVVKDGLQFEVATFRRDLNYTDGRKPQQIERSSPYEDAQRRDFTINGMFFDPSTEEIFDYVGGAADLKSGIIRAIGDPYERFIEDRLRMIRAIRFACRFGFLIDPTTHDAIVENADTLFPAVAMERVWQELKKMADGQRFEHALLELHSSGLLGVIFPTFKNLHHKTLKNLIAPLSHFPLHCPAILKLEVLFANEPLQAKLEMGQQLRISNKELAYMESSDTCRKLMAAGAHASLVDWARFYADPNSQTIIDAVIAALSEGERLEAHLLHRNRRVKLESHVNRLIQKKPLVGSLDLRQAGIPDSKLMGILLKEAEAIAITSDLGSTQEVLDKLKTSSSWPMS